MSYSRVSQSEHLDELKELDATLKFDPLTRTWTTEDVSHVFLNFTFIPLINPWCPSKYNVHRFVLYSLPSESQGNLLSLQKNISFVW